MNEFFKLFADGYADSAVLSVMVVIDTTLAVSYWFKNGRKLLSNVLLSGLLRNLALAFVPSLMQLLGSFHPDSTGLVYPLVTSIITIYIAVAILQSILAYTNMWGIKFPNWLNLIIKQEVQSKTGVKIDDDQEGAKK